MIRTLDTSYIDCKGQMTFTRNDAGVPLLGCGAAMTIKCHFSVIITPRRDSRVDHIMEASDNNDCSLSKSPVERRRWTDVFGMFHLSDGHHLWRCTGRRRCSENERDERKRGKISRSDCSMDIAKKIFVVSTST